VVPPPLGATEGIIDPPPPDVAVEGDRVLAGIVVTPSPSSVLPPVARLVGAAEFVAKNVPSRLGTIESSEDGLNVCEASKTVGAGDRVLGIPVTATVGLIVSDGDNVGSSVMVGRFVMVGLSVPMEGNTVGEAVKVGRLVIVGELVDSSVAARVGLKVADGAFVATVVSTVGVNVSVGTSVESDVGKLVPPMLGRKVAVGKLLVGASVVGPEGTGVIVGGDEGMASEVGTSVTVGSSVVAIVCSSVDPNDGSSDSKDVAADGMLVNDIEGSCVTPPLGGSDGKPDEDPVVGCCVVAPVGAAEGWKLVNCDDGSSVALNDVGSSVALNDDGSSVGDSDDDSTVSSAVGNSVSTVVGLSVSNPVGASVKLAVGVSVIGSGVGSSVSGGTTSGEGHRKMGDPGCDG
jgi:hypothetical protein